MGGALQGIQARGVCHGVALEGSETSPQRCHAFGDEEVRDCRRYVLLQAQSDHRNSFDV